MNGFWSVRRLAGPVVLGGLLTACGPSMENETLASAADWIEFSVDGRPAGRYVEAVASSFTQVTCDPLIYWGANQVQLLDNYIGGDTLWATGLALFFPNVDAVGTYTVVTDFMQATYMTGTGYFVASPGNLSGGSATVTRSDTRIAGRFAFQLVDGWNQHVLGPVIMGRFDVRAGTSCP